MAARGSIPNKSSEWTKRNLESLAIFYKERCSFLTEVLGYLRNLCGRKSRSTDHNDLAMPPIVKEIIAFTNEIWSFSVDAEDVRHVGEYRYIMDKLRRMKREFSTNECEFRTKHADLLQDHVNFRIFNDWCSRMMMFLSWWDIFLQRLRDEEARKGIYTQLYMQFSMICLLVPEARAFIFTCSKRVVPEEVIHKQGKKKQRENILWLVFGMLVEFMGQSLFKKLRIGDSFKARMRIKGIKVSGTPDVRFSRFSMYEESDTVYIVTVAEGKNLEDARRKCQNLQSEDFIAHKHLPNSLLGQHGAELLLESKRSYFRPKVSGMICVASKVIFTYLDMDIDHLKFIKGHEGSEDDIKEGSHGFRSLIHYSRPFDFMNAADRSEILETFFWLGYIQSSEYELYRT